MAHKQTGRYWVEDGRSIFAVVWFGQLAAFYLRIAPKGLFEGFAPTGYRSANRH
jgi:hypothetical protein